MVALQSFSVDAAVSDLCFVGNAGAMLAVLGGKLVWLDGTLRALEDRRQAIEQEESRQAALRLKFEQQQEQKHARFLHRPGGKMVGGRLKWLKWLRHHATMC